MNKWNSILASLLVCAGVAGLHRHNGGMDKDLLDGIWRRRRGEQAGRGSEFSSRNGVPEWEVTRRQ